MLLYQYYIMESILEKVKAQIEELLYNNAADFEIAKVLKKDIKTYFSTLEKCLEIMLP